MGAHINIVKGIAGSLVLVIYDVLRERLIDEEEHWFNFYKISKLK